MRITKYNTELDEDRKNILVKEKAINYKTAFNKLNNVESIVIMMDDCFRLSYQAEERAYMLAFDNAFHVIGVFEISHGTVNSSFADNREIYIRALLCGAAQIALVHNHPSGDIDPSKADFKATEKIIEAGKLLDIPLVDHIIVGSDDKYYSFRSENPELWKN